MKAIVTKFVPCGKVLGSRYKASDGDGNSVYCQADDTLNVDQNHEAAARKLCKKMDWHGTLIQGSLCGVGRVWVWRQSALNVALEIVV